MKRIVMAVLALSSPAFADLDLGKEVPDCAMKALDGKEFKLCDFRKTDRSEGQVVVIFFQSATCPSATKPDAVKKVVEKFAKESKVKFISVFAYHGDKEDGIKKFCEANKIDWTCVFDGDRKIAKHFGAKQVNTTFVIDPTGKLVYRGGLVAKKGEPAADAVAACLKGGKMPDSDKKFQG